MIYYGTEAFSDRGNLEGDPGKRKDFPGGWAGDAQNFFTKNNLSAEQKEFTEYLSKLMNWRKGNLAVQQGSLTHYVPEDGIYVYFRINGDQTVMVIMNNNSKEKKVETKRFNENLKGFRRGKDVMDGSTIKDLDKIEIPAKSVRILELSR